MITIFDEEMYQLEQRQQELEAQRQKLLKGLITIAIPPDNSSMQIDLGVLSAAGVERPALERRLRQTLAENPILPVLDNSFKKKHQLKEELTLTGQIPSQANNRLNSVLLANNSLDIAVKRKSSLAYSLISSPWLIILGLVVLLLWCGGPVLYALTGGAIGSRVLPVQPATTTSTPKPAMTAKRQLVSATPSLSPVLAKSKLQPQVDVDTSIEIQSERQQQSEKITFSKLNYYQTVTEQKKAAQNAFTPVKAITTETPANNPDIGNKDDSKITTEGGERVGKPSTDAGGLNGPHGAFMAPSRLRIPALELEVPVQRAITQELKSVSTPEPGSEINTSNSSTGSFGSSFGLNDSSTAGAEMESVVSWPRPGEVVHTGSYPGESGNMILLATQKNMSALRRLQQNDEVTVYDRKGNAFTYRIIAFSATGQPERVVDPALDTWIFAPTREAVLTIVVSMPMPLPVVNPNSDSSTTSLSSSTSNSQAVPRDDYNSRQKLAYRGVLALYAPTQLTPPAATPVAVPQSVWETRPAPVAALPLSPTTATTVTAPPPQPAATPAVTANPTGSTRAGADPNSTKANTPAEPALTPVVPNGLPDTGKGGAAALLQPGSNITQAQMPTRCKSICRVKD